MECIYCNESNAELESENELLKQKIIKLQNIIMASDRQHLEARAEVEKNQIISESGEIEFMRSKLTNLFRKNKRKLSSVEKKFLETPTTTLEIEVLEAQGVLKGIEKSIAVIECRATDTDLLEYRAYE